MAIDMEQFKATYIEESLEGLELMESNLLGIESGTVDSETINSIFRAAHSIKGGGATFGLSEVSVFTHSVETLLDEIRNQERSINPEIISLLLDSVDVIREMLAAEQHHEQINFARVNDIKSQLDQLLKSDATTEATSPVQNSVPSDETESGGWNIYFKPYPEMLATGNDVVRMFRELAELGEITTRVDTEQLPTLDDLNIEDCSLNWSIVLNSTCSQQEIEEIFTWVEDDCELVISPLEDEIQKNTDQNKPLPNNLDSVQSTAPVVVQAQNKQINDLHNVKAQTASKPSRNTAESSSIRVDIDKIDALINMVGELVITQSMLSELGDEFKLEKLEKLKDGLGQLERNTRELQESVMRIRMIPISFAFNRFPRMIHDMCNKFNKKVELKVSGEATELDKTVMEKIGDPLVHLVRNSMDHGIELPDERRSLGKPETGTLHLNAFHQGGNIVIEISDDGAGLNKDKIRKKAIDSGLIDENEDIADEKVYELLFRPGFSTAETITDVSGRGVGMDVVKKNIQALGGTVDVATVAGEGTTFTVRLPLTLAILDGQLVRVGEQTYIIPLVSIIESLQINQKSVNAVAGKVELYKLRDEYIPIIRFYDAFNIQPSSKDLHNGLLVVVEGDGQKAGLLVDDLLAQQQVVIKSLETNYRRVDGLSGATILGDGRVALIVDVAGLIRVSQTNMSSIDNKGVAA